MYSVESGMIETIRGETAYADLDFLDAALNMTGGLGEAALVAWDTLDEASQTFADAFTGAYQ